MFEIRKATKTQARLRMAIHGPSGSGKTMTALLIGKALGRVLVIDTERSSSEKYAELDFDISPMQPPYNPRSLIDGLPKLTSHDVVIIDGLTPFWNGAGGLLEMHDEEVKKQIANGRKVDTFAAWKNITPVYRRMVDAIISCPAHVITTLRAKTEYDRDEKGRIQKKGFAPEMRDQFDYELDIEASMIEDDGAHYMSIRKTRCSALSGRTFKNPGSDVAGILKSWLSEGAPMPVKAPVISKFDEFMGAIARRELEGLADRVNEAKNSGELSPHHLNLIRAEFSKAFAAPAVAAPNSQPKAVA